RPVGPLVADRNRNMTTSDGSRRFPWARALVLALVLTFTVTTVLATPAVAHAQEKKEEKKEGEHASFFDIAVYILTSSGLFLIPLVIVSVALVSLIVLLFMDLRMSVAVPGGFVDEFADLVNKRQFKQAFDMCRDDSSFLARVMASGMARLQY